MTNWPEKILNALKERVYLFDLAGRCVYVNRAAISFHRLFSREWQGKLAIDLEFPSQFRWSARIEV
ncbi:MAG: PAS domain-containing protein [Syntrophales bacterium]|nr:PAS domain-containing protein [Syntrophales bacterium]